MVKKNFFGKVKNTNLLLCLLGLILLYPLYPPALGQATDTATDTAPDSATLQALDQILQLDQSQQLGSLSTTTPEQIMSCNFFDPKTWDNATPTTKQDAWNYKNATCTIPVSPSLSLQATDTGASYYLDRKWDYGELFIAFLLLLILIVLIAYIIFNFFFEPVVKIRTKKWD